MAKRPLPKRMFKTQDRISNYQHTQSQSPIKLMKRVSSRHEDLLKDIESVLVACHRRDSGMDDRAASEAIRAKLNGEKSSDPRVADLVTDLARVRDSRRDVSDDDWRDALRVVDDSVRRHSSLRAGEKSYLEFVAPYVSASQALGLP